MIDSESILRRLPAGIDQRQSLLIDGIRHTAEIVELAHSRLQSTLTTIAKEAKSEPRISLIASAFLDAWSIVDAIDRFRSLWGLVTEGRPPTLEDEAFNRASQTIRNLRNVADHLAQRVDYIIAKEGTALGILSWVTLLDSTEMTGVVCVIIPGTVQKRKVSAANPGGKIDFPTGFIELTAGEYTGNLSDAVSQMALRIKELEAALQKGLVATGLEGKQAGSDLLIQMKFKFNGELC